MTTYVAEFFSGIYFHSQPRLIAVHPGERHLDSVQGKAVALQAVPNVRGGDSLALGRLAHQHGVLDHLVDKLLDHQAPLIKGLFRHPLHPTLPGQAAQARVGNGAGLFNLHSLGSGFAGSLGHLGGGVLGGLFGGVRRHDESTNVYYIPIGLKQQVTCLNPFSIGELRFYFTSSGISGPERLPSPP